MVTYTFAFKKELIAKLHDHFAEYQRDPESAWKRIALELSTDSDTPHRWQDLSAHFKRSLVYELGKFSNDQEFVDRMQYPCLRRVYSVVVELVDKTPGAVIKRKEIVEDNKLFLKSLIDDCYDPAVVAAYKRRGNKKTRITVNINVGDPVYNLTPSQRELLMKMEEQRIRKNCRGKVRRQAEPGTWHNAATGSPVVLDGVAVTIENDPSPAAKNECSARRLLDDESLDINTQEYDRMIKDSLEPEMPSLPARKRLLSIASTVESEDEELSFSTVADASYGANGISIPAEDFIVINPEEILNESTINTTTTLQLDPLQMSIQQSQQAPPPQTVENAEKDSTTSEPLFTPSSGESAKLTTTTTEQPAPVPSMIFRTEDLIAKSQPPTLILEESAATEKRTTTVVKVERLESVEVAEVGDPVEIVISDERIAEGPPNPADPVVRASALQSATSSNGVNGGPVELSGNVTRPGPVETTCSAVQNEEPAIADQTADRSIGSRTVATQTPPAKVIPVAAAAKVSVARRSLCKKVGSNSSRKSIPRTSKGLLPASYFLGDSDEEEEEEEEPSDNPTVEVQPAAVAAAEKEVSLTSNPPNEAAAEVEVRVKVPAEPPVVEDEMEAEPEEPAVSQANNVVPDAAVDPATTVAAVLGVKSSFVAKSYTPLTANGLIARAYFLRDSDDDEEEEEEEESAVEPTVEVQPAAAEKEVSSTSNPPNEAAAVVEVGVEISEEPPASVVENGMEAEPEEPAANDIVPDVAVVPAATVAVVSGVEPSLVAYSCTPLTANGLIAKSYFLRDSDDDEEEEEEEEPADNPTVEVRPAEAADKELSSRSNPPNEAAAEEVEVRVEILEEPSASVVEIGMEAEPKEPAVKNVEQIPPETVGNEDLNNNSQPKTANAKEPPSPTPAPAPTFAPPPPAAPGTTHLARSYTPVPDSQESQVDYEGLQQWSNENLLPRVGGAVQVVASDEESQVHDGHGSSNVDQVTETVAAPPKIVEKATDKPLPVETEPEKSTKNQEVVLAMPEKTNSQPNTSTAKTPPSPSPESAAAMDPPPSPPRAATPGTCHLARSCTPYLDSSTTDYEATQLWSLDNLLSGVGAIQCGVAYSSDEESEVDDDSDGSSSNYDQAREAVAVVSNVAAPSPIVEKATDKSLQEGTGPEKSTSNQDVVLVSYSASNTSTDDDLFWEECDEEDDEESDEDESVEDTSVEVQPPTATNEPNCDEESPLMAGNTVPAESVVNPEPAPSSLPTPPSSSRESTPPPQPVAAKNKLQRWHAHHAALEPFVRSHYTLYDSLRQRCPQLFQPTAPIFRELNNLNAVITSTLFPHLSPSNPARIVQFRSMVDALAIRIAYGTTLQELQGPKEPARRPAAAAALPKEQNSRRSWQIKVTSSKYDAAPPASKRIRIESSSASSFVVDDGGGGGAQSGNVSIVTIELSDSEDSPSVVLPVRKKRKYRVRQT